MIKVILLLGSNLGDKDKALAAARKKITSGIGEIVKTSSIYTSPPWGFEHSESFLNQAILINTDLNAEILLQKILEIESSIGRRRNTPSLQEKYEARVIDIDILYFEDKIISTPKLTIPHPRLHLRKFTLLPLCEIDPLFMHPVIGKTHKELLLACPDNSEVKIA